MKKHLPWIVVTSATVGILVALHFVVFAPLKTEFNTVGEDMKTSIQGLNNRIHSVQWIGETPDPRKASFSWPKLQSEIKGTFEGRLVDYDKLVESIDVALPTYDPSETIGLVLDRLAKLQELEKQNAGFRILERWGLDLTTTNGFNGTRPLNLTEGGYRSYTAEDRLDARQGTIQFAINLATWHVDDIAALGGAQQDPKMMIPQTLFHAARHRPKPEGSPDSIHPGFSSELLIQRIGYDIIATIRKTPELGTVPQGPNAGVMEDVRRVNIIPWITEAANQQQWKVFRLTWGPQPQNFQLYVDGQSSDTINAAASISLGQVPRGGGGGAYGGLYGGGGYGGGGYEGGYGGGAYGGGGYGTYGGAGYGGAYGGGGYGGAEGYYGGEGRARGGRTEQIPAITMDAFDSFVIGSDLKNETSAPLMYDALKIWDAIGDTNEPTAKPLFAEDWEHPFGSAENLDKGLRQLIRYHENLYDPLNSADVKKTYETWYNIQLMFAGLSGTKGEWINALRRLAFLDYAIKNGPVRGDMDRLARQISFPIPDPVMRDNLIIFLDLTIDMGEAMIAANVDLMQEISFLNYSNTISDEAIKQKFSEAHETLKADIQTARAAAGGMGMMGMMGMPGMGGMYSGYAGAGYGGGYPGAGYGGGYPGAEGGYGYGGGYGEEMAGPEGEDPEARKARLAQIEQKKKDAEKEYADFMEKQANLKENEAKMARWNDYMNRGEVPPDYYKEYRETQSDQGKDFFLRYSLKSHFYCGKDKIAQTLYNIEYGKRLAFLSQISMTPAAWNKDVLDVLSQVEYCFMKQVQLEAVPDQGVGSATDQQQASAAASTGVGVGL